MSSLHLTNLPWIKLYVELLFEPKLFGLSDAQRWRFVQLLLLAGYLDAEGYLVSSGKALDTEVLAWLLHCEVDALRDDLQALVGARLIVLDEAQEAWLIPSFAGRQSRPDDAQRRRWRETKRLQRSRRSYQPPLAETWDDPGEEEPLSDPDPQYPEAGRETGALISRLAAGLSADRLLDRSRTVPLKRRGD
jgi:hypothetical protein